MKYYMKPKFFAIKEDFWIKNEYGEDTFFVDKKFLSLGLQFNMIKNNEILYSVKEKLLTFLSNYEIYNSMEVVAKVNQKLTFMRDKIKVDSKYGEFTIQGNLFDYSYRIYQDNIVVAKIEKEHEERYRKLISNIEGGLVFSRDGDKIWQCRNCGHIVIGKEAPKMCPVCAHPQSYFEIKKENY